MFPTWPHDPRLTTLAPLMEALAHIATPEFAIAIGVSFVAAALHSTVGFGFSLLSVPVLALLNPLFAPVPQLLVVWPLTLAIVLRERHAVEVRSTLWIFAGRIPGAAIGVVLLKLLSAAKLDVLMSLMVIRRGLESNAFLNFSSPSRALSVSGASTVTRR